MYSQPESKNSCSPSLYSTASMVEGSFSSVNYRDGEHRGLSLPGGDGGVD